MFEIYQSKTCTHQLVQIHHYLICNPCSGDILCFFLSRQGYALQIKWGTTDTLYTMLNLSKAQVIDEMCVCATSHAFVRLQPLYTFVRLQSPLNGAKSKPTLTTAATTYCHSSIYSLVFLEQGRFDVYVLYQTACYLGVVGKQKSLQVNKLLACACFGFVFPLTISPFPSLHFHCGRLPISTLISFHSLSLFLSSDSPPSPPSARGPARAQLCLGKADCGVPGKPLQERQESGGGEYLTQHIYSTADILVSCCRE